MTHVNDSFGSETVQVSLLFSLRINKIIWLPELVCSNREGILIRIILTGGVTEKAVPDIDF